MSFKEFAKGFGYGFIGMNYEDVKLRQMAQQEAERRHAEQLAMDKDRLRLARETEDRQARAQDLQMQEVSRKFEEEDAVKTAAAGFRRGEMITQFTAPGGQQSTVVGTSPEAQAKQGFRPGLYQEQPTQDEAYAEVMRQDELNKQTMELNQQQFDNRGKQVTENRLQSELNLDRQREQRNQEMSSKTMNLLDEKIRIAKESGLGKLTIEQARDIVSDLYQDSDMFDADDPDSAFAQVSLIEKVQEWYNNPESRSRLGAAVAIAKMDQRHSSKKVFTDDQSPGSKGAQLGPDVEALSRLMGEESGQRPQAPPYAPILPAKNGVPDPRALDMSVSFHQLIGADPEVQGAIQGAEMKQDGEEMQAAVRNLMATGVPEVEWHPALLAFVEAMRNPDRLKGLQ